jgi:phosphopantetheinyl transferase
LDLNADRFEVTLPDAKPLADHEVHLWALPQAAAAREALCVEGYALLSRAEQDCHRALARPARARRYLLGRILLRRALACHLACAPGALVISQTGNGKLVAEQARHAGLDFSLSHARAETVLAVARARAVGVDLEPLTRGTTVRRIAARFFHEAERRQIDASGEQADELALSLWTLKEAAVKAAGSTIWKGLGDCAFDVSNALPVWLAAPPLGAAGDWRLALGRFSGDHRLAIALWRPAAPAGSVIWQTHVLGGGALQREILEIGAGSPL